MYQSVWSGPLADCKQETYMPLLEDIYGGGKANAELTEFCKLITLIIWAFAIVFLILFARKTSGWEIMFMYFVGGMIFHTFWEGKSQYIFPYVFVLIPFAMYALYRVCRFDAFRKLRARGATKEETEDNTLSEERSEGNE